jgi:hypothetical protein
VTLDPKAQKKGGLGGALESEPFDPARAPLRMSPAERASLRAAEVRGHLGDKGLDEGSDEFYIDRTIIPDGWDYEWKMVTVTGKEFPAHQLNLARHGWEPVPRDRHPELMPQGSQDAHVTRNGLVLMERPLELTEEAKNIELKKARVQVRAKEEQLSSPPPGTFDRVNKSDPLIKVKKSYVQEAIPVPDGA